MKLNCIKEVLEEKNIQNKWISEQLGKSTCIVSKWCKNTVQPDLQTLAKIAELLNVEKRVLLTENKLNGKRRFS